MGRWIFVAFVMAGIGCGEVDADADGSPEGTDCDDNDPARFPGAEEICDSIDNNCDGTVDEGAVGNLTYFADVDGDGFGDDAVSTTSCLVPDGYVAKGGDCDDTQAQMNPDLLEVCYDGLDNDCDGTINQCQLGTSLYLSGSGVELRGAADGDFGGYQVRAGGDFFGDGHPAMVVSAPLHDKGTGAVYVVEDPGASASLEDISQATIRGAAGEGFGWTTTVPGDLDGDGSTDLIAGAAGSEKVYLFNGPIAGELSSDDADAEFVEEDTGLFTGYVSDEAGDLNDDGQDDALIGVGLADDGAGAVYVVSGAPSGTITMASSSMVKLSGSDADEYFGIYAGIVGPVIDPMAGAGDLNGDGVDDLLVGAFGPAAVYVWYGPITASSVSTNADEIVTSSHFKEGDYYGFSVAGAGDSNGDGYGDFAVGAPYDSTNSKFGNGAVYLNEGPAKTGMAEDVAFAELKGNAIYSTVGHTIVGGHDLNRDGVDDLVVGGVYYSAGNQYSGAAFVAYGPITASSNNIEGEGTAIYGSGSFHYAGYSLALPGDVNADGVEDLVVGAPGAKGDATSAGSAFLIYGVAP